MSWKKLQDNSGKEIHSGTRKFYTCIIYFDAGWVSFFREGCKKSRGFGLLLEDNRSFTHEVANPMSKQ